MNVTAMGKVGLSGWRSKAADVVARPVAKRTRMSEEQIKAIIGGVFLAVTLWQLSRTIWRAVQEGRRIA